MLLTPISTRMALERRSDEVIIMPKGEKEAWLNVVEPHDLDTHMANIEQAQTNAGIIRDFFNRYPLSKGSKLLIHGCGPCQMFDYISPSDIGDVEITFADLSPRMLEAGKERLKKFKRVSYRTLVDDIEKTKITSRFYGVLLTLVLLHTDWKKSLANMCSLSPSALYIIEQEQKPGTSPIALERELPPSIKRYAETTTPGELIPRSELTCFLKGKGYNLVYTKEKQVPDNKVMVGLVYRKGE